MNKFIILTDTRQQKEKHILKEFDKQEILHIRTGLPSADYMALRYDGKKGKLKYSIVYQICKDINNIKHPLNSRQIRLLGEESTKYDELSSLYTSWSFDKLDMLYDLIKADLVEKVGD